MTAGGKGSGTAGEIRTAYRGDPVKFTPPLTSDRTHERSNAGRGLSIERKVKRAAKYAGRPSVDALMPASA